MTLRAELQRPARTVLWLAVAFLAGVSVGRWIERSFGQPEPAAEALWRERQAAVGPVWGALLEMHGDVRAVSARLREAEGGRTVLTGGE